MFTEFNKIPIKETHYRCPYCKRLHDDIQKAKDCSKKEQEWQERWKDQDSKYARFVDHQGQLVWVGIIRRVSRHYCGKSCGHDLTLHVAKTEKADMMAFGQDERHCNARESLNECFPASEDEYQKYLEIPEHGKKELFDKKFDEDEEAIFSGAIKHLKENKDSMKNLVGMFDSLDGRADKDPWDPKK